MALLLQGMRDPAGAGSAHDLLKFGAAVAGLSAVFSLPWAVRASWRLLRHRAPERSIRQIGKVVLESLVYEGSIHRSTGRAAAQRVFAEKNRDGTVFCWIAGQGYEQAAFLRAMAELLGPVEDARFLLARQSWGNFREDYFAVPDALARKKEFAEFFAERWRRAVGPVALVYTRTPEGRRLLLRARVHSLAASFQKGSERVSCWK
jgi:hypothetical protein